MPRQFSPSDREEVLEVTRERDAVFAAGVCGDGIVVRKEHDNTVASNYTGLVENHGWYLALSESADEGDLELLMPITEVPE